MMDDVHYNDERLGTIFFDIRTYIQDFKNLNIDTIEDLRDKRNYYAASMILFSLLNRLLDLGTEITIANNLGIPATYRDIFVTLRKHGFIDDELASEMIGLVTYRNLLSHEYHGITEKDLLVLKNKIPAIQRFAEEMQRTIVQTK
jgi:uncharacterized protein YutE (UPF0331/DUF86 family)